jgi:hypothetical protein
MKQLDTTLPVHSLPTAITVEASSSESQKKSKEVVSTSCLWGVWYYPSLLYKTDSAACSASSEGRAYR